MSIRLPLKRSGFFQALLLVAAVIAYVCLYPFRFHPLEAGAFQSFWHSWPAGWSRFMARDGVINIILYVPLGIFGFLSLDFLPDTRLRLLLPVMAAICFSSTIEFLQLMIFTRTSSVYDVVCNTIGAAVGVAAGRFYVARIFQFTAHIGEHFTPSPPALLLFFLWVGYQLFPFIPSLGLFRFTAGLRGFLAQAPLAVSATLFFAVEWLTVGAIMKKLLKHTASRLSLFPLLLVLPARFFVFGRSVSSSELLGAVLGCILWVCWFSNMRHAKVALGLLLVATMILRGLSPYRFHWPPQHFSWVPFAGIIETGPQWGAVIGLKKSFTYGAAIWALNEAGAGYLICSFGIAALLGAIEWIQRYLPGRTPEISDPLLALLLAAMLHLLRSRTSTFAEYRASQPVFSAPPNSDRAL